MAEIIINDCKRIDVLEGDCVSSDGLKAIMSGSDRIRLEVADCTVEVQQAFPGMEPMDFSLMLQEGVAKHESLELGLAWLFTSEADHRRCTGSEKAVFEGLVLKARIVAGVLMVLSCDGPGDVMGMQEFLIAMTRSAYDLCQGVADDGKDDGAAAGEVAG